MQSSLILAAGQSCQLTDSFGLRWWISGGEGRNPWFLVRDQEPWRSIEHRSLYRLTGRLHFASLTGQFTSPLSNRDSRIAYRQKYGQTRR